MYLFVQRVEMIFLYFDVCIFCLKKCVEVSDIEWQNIASFWKSGDRLLGFHCTITLTFSTFYIFPSRKLKIIFKRKKYKFCFNGSQSFGVIPEIFFSWLRWEFYVCFTLRGFIECQVGGSKMLFLVTLKIKRTLKNM